MGQVGICSKLGESTSRRRPIASGTSSVPSPGSSAKLEYRELARIDFLRRIVDLDCRPPLAQDLTRKPEPSLEDLDRRTDGTDGTPRHPLSDSPPSLLPGCLPITSWRSALRCTFRSGFRAYLYNELGWL